MLVAGERRWLATMNYVKADVIEGRVLGDEAALKYVRQRAAENLHRENLTPVEEAAQYADLAESGMSQKDIADFVGKSQPAVANSLRILKLPKSVRAMIHEGKLERAYGIALCRFAKWPKVVEVMAGKIVNDEHMTSKQFDRQEVPYAWELKNARLCVEIGTSSYNGGYDISKFKGDDDFIVRNEAYAYCLNPEKWAKEQVAQDAARVAAAKQAQLKKNTSAAKKGGDTKPTPEQLARKKKIATNKANRALIAQGLNQALNNLRAASGISSTGLRVVAAKASSFGYGHSFDAAAKAIGIKLPKGGRSGLDALSDGELVKLVAGAIIIGQGEDAARHASKLPESISLIAGKLKPLPVEAPKKPAPAKTAKPAVKKAAPVKSAKKAKPVKITPEIKSQVIALVQAGRTGAEIAKEICISLPSVQNIKKEAGLVKAKAEARLAAKEGDSK